MNFADLYRYSNGLDLQATPITLLRQRVIAFHPTVGEVEFWACKLNRVLSFGHIHYEIERDSPYGDPYDIASIRFSDTLNRCWRRFVCCKELMHVFDDSHQRVDNREKAKTLLEELQTNPLSVDESPMYESERDAEWMALLILCPERLRNKYLPDYKSSPERDLEIAQALKIPRGLIRAAMGEYYLRALERLTGEPGAAAE